VLVFVHGVPETAALWDKIRSQLDEPSVALSLPGFGTARPAGFGATKDAYADWLLEQLRGFATPVDLVGHDWGGLLTHRIATSHPEVLRAFVTDALLVPGYEWHRYAKVWQTPGEGEAFWDAVLGTAVEDRAAIYERYGISNADATTLTAAFDATMAGCILDLYRSAVPNPWTRWEFDPAAPTAPGLVLVASEDEFSSPQLVGDLAAASGLGVARLEGVGHWWALQEPELAARELTRFFAAVR